MTNSVLQTAFSEVSTQISLKFTECMDLKSNRKTLVIGKNQYTSSKVIIYKSRREMSSVEQDKIDCLPQKT